MKWLRKVALRFLRQAFLGSRRSIGKYVFFFLCPTFLGSRRSTEKYVFLCFLFCLKLPGYLDPDPSTCCPEPKGKSPNVDGQNMWISNSQTLHRLAHPGLPRARPGMLRVHAGLPRTRLGLPRVRLGL